MNGTWEKATPGFGERGQEPFGDIPTEPEAFLRWGASLDPNHPYKYELSRGKVSRMMIGISRAHWRVTLNILAELLAMLDRDVYEPGPAEFGVRTGIGVRYPDVIVDRASSSLKDLACEAPIVIVEVLSPSTAGVDFTAKLQEYTAIELGADLSHLQPGRAPCLGLVETSRWLVAEFAHGAGRPRRHHPARRTWHRPGDGRHLPRHPRRAHSRLTITSSST